MKTQVQLPDDHLLWGDLQSAAADWQWRLDGEAAIMPSAEDGHSDGDVGKAPDVRPAVDTAPVADAPPASGQAHVASIDTSGVADLRPLETHPATTVPAETWAPLLTDAEVASTSVASVPADLAPAPREGAPLAVAQHAATGPWPAIDDHGDAAAGGPGKIGAAAPAAATIVSNTAATLAAPADPYFGLQWHLDNTGQAGGPGGIDINVLEVWNDYTGAGVVVGDVDTGVQLDHPDLAGQFNTTLDHDAAGQDDDPSYAAGEFHATSVSGVIAAAEGNDLGVVGVAYDSQVSVFRMDFAATTEDQVAENLALQSNVDVSSNSWGYTGFFEDNFASPDFAGSAAAIENAVATGRGGLGTVFVFAAGNGGEEGQNVNYHSFQNSPDTIAVGGIDANGVAASFSTPGAALLVTAPAVGIVTTDVAGTDGYVDGDYVAISGTSFAAPMVSGVAALMLEANPDLGYRDVQQILAYSATQTDPGDSGWAYNGATDWNGGGLHFNELYGFGLVDAHAAVRLAETWPDTSTYGNLVTSTWQWNGGPLDVPDAHTRGHSSKPGVLETTITVTDPTDIDHVGVSLDLSHTYIGDLVITLASPDGTLSTLVDRPGQTLFNPWGSGQDNIVFDLSTTHDWGETGVGDWTLAIYDLAAGDTGTLNDWSLTFYGDAVTADDVYVYTDEYGGLAGGGTSTASTGTTATADTSSGGTLQTASLDAQDLDAYARGGTKGPPPKDGGGGTSGDTGRTVLDDHDGGTDTINLSPVTSDTVLDLHDGATSTVAGAPLTIAAGTVIENAFLGDGNDIVLGNDVANMLDGGRGDDWLQGNKGPDQVTGGDGADFFVLNAGDGGMTTADADLILDFQEGVDVIGVPEAVNLAFTAKDATGDGVEDTVISDATTGELLAVVSEVATVGPQDVVTVTPIA